MIALTILVAVAALILLITVFRWHPVPALLLVTIGTGLALHMPILSPEGVFNAEGEPVLGILDSMKKGIGGTLGDIAVLLGLGAMLGGVIAKAGATEVIANSLVGKENNPQRTIWLIGLAGFLVGIPLFYTVGFVMLVPIIFAAASRTGLPLAMVGVATVAALSVTHGFLPPHPAPVMLTEQFEADMGKVMLYGLLLAVPAVIIAGPLFAQTLKGLHSSPPELFQAPETTGKRPGLGLSILMALSPVILIGGTRLIQALPFAWAKHPVVDLLANPNVALLIGLLLAMWLLGRATQRSIGAQMQEVGEHLTPVANVLLIIACGGALKQLLVESGTADTIKTMVDSWQANPLLIGWSIAALARIALGSATVAAITAMGLAGGLITPGVSPELMVLAIGAGSLTCSHVNDTGFWLFKSYFGLTVGQTFRSWTMMETIVSLIGLGGVLLLAQWV
ncbi:MAG: gluconate:H+ symporter [Bacteroidota bacterium]